MRRIEQLLEKTIGLDAASIGSASIQRAVRVRMRSLGLRRLEDYKQFLEESRAEWNELVESVIVTETWFFRDAEAFAAVVRLVLEEWLPAHPDAPVRLLSLPCASGEEPYSLAMALLDAGVASARFQIDAVDISARALAQAERAIYGKNSFRGEDLAYRDRYFQPSKQGFVLVPAVRHCVKFRRGNLFSELFRHRHSCYDFIFCRNLLIYFDRPMQRRAIEKIERLLVPSGVMIVSPVEQPLLLNHGFVSTNIPGACAYRKAQKAVRSRRTARLSKQPVIPAGLQPSSTSQSQLPYSRRTIPPAVGRGSLSRHADLETARRLADVGHLEAAAEVYEAHLLESKASAQAYYLLGLVRDAAGDTRALDCYRKALYLEPDHYESLLQMALLLQKNGDPIRARTFKSRAQRVKMRLD